MDATVNSLLNSAQEIAVDGMARERQQYSGDCGHQLQTLYTAFGDARLPARFIRTFGMGMTLDGYFFDCWPAHDRLARLMERQLGLTEWGPILDHGIGFNFDCWHYYMHTGDPEPVREIFPHLERFLHYLEGIQGADGLLPVENLGVPSVWIDHDAYKLQRHKQCAFNLYAAGMLSAALAPLGHVLNLDGIARRAEHLSEGILRGTTARYWDDERGIFVANKPWAREEGGIRLCDRSLASSILFRQCPEDRVENAGDVLATCPPEMGFSYPANAIWRLWALAELGRGDCILADLRTRWATMDSVRLNNTLQEYWKVTPDSSWQWSHCAVSPLIILFQGILGLHPVEAGFKRYEIKPLGVDLASTAMTAYLPQGELKARWEGGRTFTVRTPPEAAGEIILNADAEVHLKPMGKGLHAGQVRYALPQDSEVILHMRGI
jgi:hypothetical protein